MTRLVAPLVLLLLPLLLAAPCTRAVTLRGQVQPNHILRDFFLVGPNAKVTAYPANLTASGRVVKYEAYIRRDGSWSLELPDPTYEASSVTPAASSPVDGGNRGKKDADAPTAAKKTTPAPPRSDVYLLKYSARALTFPDYRVDVRPPKRQGMLPSISVRIHNPTLPLSSALYLQDPLPHPLMSAPQSVHTYFASIQDFNALNYLVQTLKSPMILMALGAWAMVSLMPKLMANLDPDEAAQMQRTQTQMANRMTALHSGDWKTVLESDGSAEGKKGASGVSVGAGGSAKKRR